MICVRSETKLDRIIEHYNGRIDAAIEVVCDRYDLIEIDAPCAGFACSLGLQQGGLGAGRPSYKIIDGKSLQKALRSAFAVLPCCI